MQKKKDEEEREKYTSFSDSLPIWLPQLELGWSKARGPENVSGSATRVTGTQNF